jgi:hypothetical protein
MIGLGIDFGRAGSADGELIDLVDEMGALERALGAPDGTFVRHLTEIVRKERTFEFLCKPITSGEGWKG